MMTQSLKRCEISSGNEKRLECSQRWHEDTSSEARCEIQFRCDLYGITFLSKTKEVDYLQEQKIEFELLNVFQYFFFFYVEYSRSRQWTELTASTIMPQE